MNFKVDAPLTGAVLGIALVAITYIISGSFLWAAFVGFNIFWISVVCYLAFHSDKAESLAGLVSRGLSFLGDKHKKRSVVLDLQSKVNASAREINKESGGLMAYGLQIEWVDVNSPRESFIRNGDVVVRLDYNSNPERNLVVTVLAFLKKALLSAERPYIDKDVSRGLDLTVAKSMIDKVESRGASAYILDEIIMPECNTNSALEEYCVSLAKVQKSGYLTRVLLRSLIDLARRARPGLPTDSSKRQSCELVKFICQLADREPGEIVPLTFKSELLKFHVVLVAKKETRLAHGIWPYVQSVRTSFQTGIERVFILAIGQSNVEIADRALRQLRKNEQAELIDEQHYEIASHDTGKLLPAVFMECKSMQKVILQKLQRVFAEHIPYAADGLIDIMAFGRIVGERCKVAVRSNRNDVNAVGACIGNKAETVKAISKALGEQVEVIPWSDNPERLIRNALFRDELSDIQVFLNTETHAASVIAPDSRAKAIIVGHEFKNLDLAVQLTGWRISVQTQEEAVSELDNEKELILDNNLTDV